MLGIMAETDKPRNPVKALNQLLEGAGLKLVDLTGIIGRDPTTGAVIREDGRKGIEQRRAERDLSVTNATSVTDDPNGTIYDKLFGPRK